jgi:hypothetical protein
MISKIIILVYVRSEKFKVGNAMEEIILYMLVVQMERQFG